jgi:hypothetical protein
LYSFERRDDQGGVTVEPRSRQKGYDRLSKTTPRNQSWAAKGQGDQLAALQSERTRADERW